MSLLSKDKALRIYHEAAQEGSHYKALQAVQTAVLALNDKECGMDMTTYQRMIDGWMEECFQGVTPLEQRKSIRSARFLEEALELYQANGLSKESALQLVDYVFNRPVGEPHQEVGGVMVTLAALCTPCGIDLNSAAVSELERINTPEMMDKIRRKQASKVDPDGPLPGSAA